MNSDRSVYARLQFLLRVVGKESRYLVMTAERLFAEPFSEQRAALLERDIQLSETVEAFVARFRRLQDTLGDKLIPVFLEVAGEARSLHIDNLDKAEKFGWIDSADTWMEVRKLRNLMIHEYIEDIAIFCEAINRAKTHLPQLLMTVECLSDEAIARGWSEA